MFYDNDKLLKNKFVYLDNAATSFYKPIEVRKAVNFAIENLTANPGRSGHMLSQKVAEIVAETRDNVLDFLVQKIMI